ncbi:MAG: hypothetical protein Tsb0034_01520 [Ekhidna sp.]
MSIVKGVFLFGAPLPEDPKNDGISEWKVLNHELLINDAEPLLQLGFENIQNGEYKEAVHNLTKALSSSKNHHELIYFYRGLAKYAQSDYMHAETDFTRCLLTMSTMADAYFLRGLCRYETGDFKLAQVDFKKAQRPGKAMLTTSFSEVITAIDSYNNRLEMEVTDMNSLAKN